MSVQIPRENELASCFGVGHIFWNPMGYGLKHVFEIGNELMCQIDDFIGAEATVYGFTPAGATGADHGAIVLELRLGAATTRIGINFGGLEPGGGFIRRGFDAEAWRRAPSKWDSSGIWLANPEEALAFLCVVGRALELPCVTFVYGSDRSPILENTHCLEQHVPRFQLGTGFGRARGFDAPFVGAACTTVLREWRTFSGGEMDVRFFTPKGVTWMGHAAMVIQVRRGDRHASVGAQFAASTTEDRVYRKELNIHDWKAAPDDWRSSGLHLRTWTEAWGLICALGERLGVRRASMSYGEADVEFTIRTSDELAAR